MNHTISLQEYVNGLTLNGYAVDGKPVNRALDKLIGGLGYGDAGTITAMNPYGGMVSITVTMLSTGTLSWSHKDLGRL